MRITTIVLATVLGCFMLFNGINELFTDTFFAFSIIPRPWVDTVLSFGINIVALGPLFIVWGIMWLYFAFLLCVKARKAYLVGILISVPTLLYFPFGTIISVATISLLKGNKKPSGLLR